VYNNIRQWSSSAGRIRLAAHLARATDDVGKALAAVLAALKAHETFESTEEAVLGGATSAKTGSLLVLAFLLFVGRRTGGHDRHLDSLGLGAVGLGGGGRGVLPADEDHCRILLYTMHL